MGRRLYIPDQVLDSIANHISTAVPKAIEGFWSANEDEDTLTGHLGACLKTGMHTVDVTQSEIKGPWKWSIDYSKFRGRGKNATESYLGADGILELALDTGNGQDTKSLLFQSKIDWDNSPDLVEQALVMSTWREAAIGINYTATAFEAYSIDSILASRGLRSNAKGSLSLQDALTQYFLQCKIGNTELRYDARRRQLYWRDINGLVVSVQFSVPQRIRMNVEAPQQSKPSLVDKELSPAEIHNHRLKVEPQEVLMPLLAPAATSQINAKRPLAMIYHPDRYHALDQTFRDLATRRMQEINDAESGLRKRRKRDN